MQIVKVTYDTDYRCNAIHIESSSQIVTAAPKDNNGDGSSFSPTDLLCTSLATCCLTIMAIRAKQSNLPFQDVSVEVHKTMTDNPRKVGAIRLDFSIGDTWNEKQRKLMEEAAKTCPVFLSLHPDMNKELAFSYLADALD